MKIIYEYSHLGGSEILQVRYPKINQEVYEVISNVKAMKLKKSKEKNMVGKMLFSPKDMNNQFGEKFNALDFNEIRDYYTIEIPNYPLKIERSYKQIDFVKEKVLVEVQFGKYAFMFYDMAKFQYSMKIKRMLVSKSSHVITCSIKCPQGFLTVSN